MRYKVMRPNLRTIVYSVPFETNAYGFRDLRLYTTRRKHDVCRVSVMGESFTACAGVPFDEMTTTRLERLMNEACPRRRRTSVRTSRRRSRWKWAME